MNGRLMASVCLWALLLSPFVGSASAAKFNKKLDFGDKAPDWSGLDGADGKRHGLDDYKKAKVLVIAFSCNQCAVSELHEERFISFTKKYEKKGVRFVVVSCSKHPADRLEKMKEHAKEKKFNFDYVIDPSQNVGRSYGATVTPHLFVLDKDRKIAYMGAFDDSAVDVKKVETAYVRDAVEALLAGKEVEIKESRQKGCSIVYED